jgi:hypothetical protein
MGKGPVAQAAGPFNLRSKLKASPEAAVQFAEQIKSIAGGGRSICGAN